MQKVLLVVVIAALAAWSPVASAELTAVQAKTAGELLKRLEGADLDARRQAAEHLLTLGPDVIPLVRKFIAETRDADAQVRGETVLKKLLEQHADVLAETLRRPEETPPVSLEPSKLTMSLKDVTPADVLKQFAHDSGNAPLELAPNLNNVVAKTVSFEAKDLTYWQALDKLCRELKLVYDLDSSTGKVKLVPKGDIPVDIGTSAGPVTLKITNGHVARSSNMPGNLTYGITCGWEDRLPVVNVKTCVTEVISGDGRALNVPAPPDRARVREGHVMLGAPPAPSVLFMASVQALPAKLEKIASLTGTVELETGVGIKKVAIANVLRPEEQVGRQEDVAITVSPTEERPGVISLSVRHERAGTPGPLSVGIQGTRYGFFLVDSQGKRYPGNVTPSYYKLKDHHLESILKDKRPVSMSYYGGRDDGTYSVHFFGIPKNPGVLTLLWAYPERVETKEYMFTFKDVPLP